MGNRDTYPLAAVATLRVRDPVASARWYREALGFQVVHERPGLNGTPVAVHLRRARHQDMVLARAERPAPGGVSLTFWVNDLDELASRARGVRRNECELVVLDPDGYELVFCRRTWPDGQRTVGNFPTQSY